MFSALSSDGVTGEGWGGWFCWWLCSKCGRVDVGQAKTLTGCQKFIQASAGIKRPLATRQHRVQKLRADRENESRCRFFLRKKRMGSKRAAEPSDCFGWISRRSGSDNNPALGEPAVDWASRSASLSGNPIPNPPKVKLLLTPISYSALPRILCHGT